MRADGSVSGRALCVEFGSSRANHRPVLPGRRIARLRTGWPRWTSADTVGRGAFRYRWSGQGAGDCPRACCVRRRGVERSAIPHPFSRRCRRGIRSASHSLLRAGTCGLHARCGGEPTRARPGNEQNICGDTPSIHDVRRRQDWCIRHCDSDRSDRHGGLHDASPTAHGAGRMLPHRSSNDCRRPVRHDTVLRSVPCISGAFPRRGSWYRCRPTWISVAPAHRIRPCAHRVMSALGEPGGSGVP